MKTTLLLTLALLSPLAAHAAKSYQVTGPVLEVTANSIVVQKGKERWEMAKDATTKGPEVKVGDKVTVYYSMTATEIESKAATEAKKKK